jgi:hypothetical protein
MQNANLKMENDRLKFKNDYKHYTVKCLRFLNIYKSTLCHSREGGNPGVSSLNIWLELENKKILTRKSKDDNLI